MSKYVWKYKTKTIAIMDIHGYEYSKLDEKVSDYLNGGIISSHKFVSMSTTINSESGRLYCTIITKYKEPISTNVNDFRYSAR